MSGNDTDVVREILETAFSRPVEEGIRGIAESVVIQSATGHVYIGHAGFREWVKRARAVYRESRFEEDELRNLGGGFVLLVGTTYSRNHDDELEAQPGAWLMHTDAGRLTTIVFFRTAADALAAASSVDTPAARRKVVEEVVAAFNRNDFNAILASVAADYRFSTPMFDGVEFEGHFDAADVLEAVSERFDAYKIDSHRITELGGGFIALDTRNRVLRDGVVRRFEGTWLIRIEGGLFRETTFHAHLDEAVAAFEARAGRGDWLVAGPDTVSARERA